MDKLFVPLWVSLAVFFTLDFFVLGKAYAFDYIVRSFLGFFPNADVFADLNSPLWYITLILFYYLLFPLLFSPKRPVVSVGAFLAVSYAVLWLNPQFFSNVRHLYELHVWAFPAGVLLAAVLRDKSIVKISSPPIYWATLAALTVAIGYFALNGNVGAGVYLEQVTSILTALLFCTFFVIKKFEVRLLYLFGMFSYEIYLLHWPIMSRYDIFFRFLPPWLALSMYFALFLGLGWCLQAGIKKLSAR